MRLFFILILIYGLTQSLQAQSLQARGASFPKTVYADWIDSYYKQTGIRIRYEATGSGDGIVSIVHRQADFAGSDKPLKPWRLKRYKLHMFPTLVGCIVLAYNLPGIPDGALKLSEEAIAAIFSGEALFWDDARITKHNPSLPLPHQPIKLAVRADGSGTTYNMTWYLRKIDYEHFPKAKKKFPWKPKTISADGSSNLSKLIQSTPYSIGYVDYSKKLKFSLPAATIENRSGNWIPPSLKAAQKSAALAHLDKEKDFYGIIAYKNGNESYPLVATTFILLPKENQVKNREITRFFQWAFTHGEAIANKHGFALLPQNTLNDISQYWAQKAIAPTIGKYATLP